ncbi:MAG: bifunctional folylpolyglutamate synthase/dihydrofolate synthase [Planctomycetes bacterium]|nr:bifunctional folylpolyglutamate synthase/dihydrofolate synthase [Planctomycetota bacterium]
MTMHHKTLPRFEEAVEYLSAFTNYERVTDYKVGPATMGTERIEELLKRLGLPHTSAPVLHIAGTKGKGSTAHLTERLLNAKGYKTGLFTSPHLESILERFRINGKPLGEEGFCEAFAKVQPHVEAMKNHPRMKPPTYFETITAIGFVAFQQAEVDAVVLEVGLGGRLDATNVHGLPVIASAISTISIDHTKQLGNTLLEIAGEKAGIMRESTPVVLGPQESSVMAFLKECAKTLDCHVIAVGKDVTVSLRSELPANAPEAPQRLDLSTWRSRHYDVPLPLMGAHQLNNAAVALGLAERFLEWDNNGPLDTATIRKAWRSIHIPGRLEIMDREPWILLDGAHNPASAWAISEAVYERFPPCPRTMVFSVNRDKDCKGMLRILAPMMDNVIITTNGSPRGTAPDEIMALMPEQFGGKAVIEEDIGKAIELGREMADKAGLVIITGSLYLVGKARTIVNKDAD